MTVAATATGAAPDALSQRDFARLARYIHETSGIRMPPTKRTMLEGRLRKRVRALDLPDLASYCRYLFDLGGLAREAVSLIDVVTTNKTEFFREPGHFQYLLDKGLPDLAERGAGVVRPLQVWSAACSTGAEPYTLAMVLGDFGAALRGYRFGILGTDISTQVLHKAVVAIYPEEAIAPVPMDMRRRYLLRSRGHGPRQVRIAPELRRHVRFQRVNLIQEPYGVDDAMDIVFCRNLLIYFDKPTQEAVLRRLTERLRPGGLLFVGHSESVTGFDLPLRTVANSVFVRA
ncbi:MAG: chemotaxis protein CheR [Magnetospirillum sp.]|nr:chemotaxis protein CheR [Magnetospirillum sp.]